MNRSLITALFFSHFLLIHLPAGAELWDANAIAKMQESRIQLIAGSGASSRTAAVVDRADIVRLVSITERIAPHLGVAAPRIYIKADASLNAFVTTGVDGKAMMVFHTQMLEWVGSDEGAMAAVVGHELAHISNRHLGAGSQRTAVVLGTLIGLAVDAAAARRNEQTLGAGRQLGNLGGQLVAAKFSRDQEREADQAGIVAMARAGFDPGAAVELWRRIRARGDAGSSGTWLDSHPSPSEREADLAVAATANRTVYEQAALAANQVQASVPLSRNGPAGLVVPLIDRFEPVASTSGIASGDITAVDLGGPATYKLLTIRKKGSVDIVGAADRLSARIMNNHTDAKVEMRATHTVNGRPAASVVVSGFQKQRQLKVNYLVTLIEGKEEIAYFEGSAVTDKFDLYHSKFTEAIKTISGWSDHPRQPGITSGGLTREESSKTPVSSRIRELKKLLDEGLISQNEYEAKRTELLRDL